MSLVASEVGAQIGQVSCPGTGTSGGFAGVVLDVPDVVYDATLWRRWLFQLLGRFGISSDYGEFNSRWELQLRDVNRGRRELGEALQAFLLSYRLSWAQIDEIEAASRIQRQALDIDVRPLPGVVAAARSLNQSGLPLVAWADLPLTCANLVERLERILPRIRFHAVFTSLELEHAQPEPQCYRAIIDALAAPPERILYVGHDAEHLTAAHDAGLRTAALGPVPARHLDYELRRLDELTSLCATAHGGLSHSVRQVQQDLSREGQRV